MHDHDQDYEVAEPAATPGEDSDTHRSHTARFWRSQSSPASSAEADPASAGSADSETGPDSQAVAAGDPDVADETALGDETALDDDVVIDDDAALDDEDVLLGGDDVVVVAEVMDAGPRSPAADEQRFGSPVVVPAAREAADLDAADLDATDLDATDLDATGPEATPEPALVPIAVPSDADADAVPAAAAGRRDVAGAADPAVGAEPDADRPEQAFGSQEWREIQATFVDDPHAAVQMAAQAADSALTALVTALREQQASLDPSATRDTEQLRAALQEYRRFSQAISEVGRSLPRSAASR